MVVPVSRDALDSGMKTDVNLNHEVYYHFLGTEQSQDVLCWRDPDHPKYIHPSSHRRRQGKLAQLIFFIHGILVQKKRFRTYIYVGWQHGR
jgi:hypothetical protein